jgi:prevent-host-death family protein
LYNVHVRRYTVAQIRARLAEALDSAERGQPVLVERRGVRFRIESVRPRRRAKAGAGLIVSVDAAVEAGRWSWEWERGALRFSGRRRG